jgi:hypothetical protein
MKSDINGCSTCPTGKEHYETFMHHSMGHTKEYIQYDYRHTTSELFSCVAPDLENARYRRDKWLKSKIA